MNGWIIFLSVILYFFIGGVYSGFVYKKLPKWAVLLISIVWITPFLIIVITKIIFSR